MDNNAILKGYSPLELMLKWNRYCDTHNREADCILLNEERTYTEAFDDEQQAIREIVNSTEPEFKRDDDGFLVPLYENKLYAGMMYVPFDKIGEHIDLHLIENQQD